MTREEAIEWMDWLKLDIKQRGYNDIVTALNMAIKALEQESILDKAIAEIDRVGCVCHASDNYDELIRKNTVLKILNKYKAEIEVEDGN